MSQKLKQQKPKSLQRIKLIGSLLIILTLCVTYLAWLNSGPQKLQFKIEQTYLTLQIPTIVSSDIPKIPIIQVPSKTLHPKLSKRFKQQTKNVNAQIKEQKARERQQQINRVESFFKSYGSNMVGYGNVFVDQAKRCGGDYRILVGIAGSESGLGRLNYKKYNPFGYLNGVQYSGYAEALPYLTCRISIQHIAPCGQDLYCLANRYAGPQDDLDHFVNKVRWFMNQV